jgi:GT2 family glycosyltransferase
LVRDGEALHSASGLPSVVGEMRYFMPRRLKWLFPERRLEPGAEPGGTVAYVLGACFLVDRDLFEQLGGLNESMFMFFEEADFSRRVHLAGRSEALCTAAVAEHALGATRVGDAVGLRDEYLRSAVLYFEKWHGRPSAVAFRLCASVVLSVIAIAPSRRRESRVLRRALWTRSERKARALAASQ